VCVGVEFARVGVRREGRKKLRRIQRGGSGDG